jgi:hypothetical protein
MTDDPNDVVKVAAGSFVAIEMYQRELKEAGIPSKVVGLNLEAAFGTAIPDSIELWVHRSDAERAAAVIERTERERGRQVPEPPHEHPRPTSDAKPPTHGGRPHTHYDADPRSG